MKVVDKRIQIITCILLIGSLLGLCFAAPALDENNLDNDRRSITVEESDEMNWQHHVARLIETVDEKYYKWFLREQKSEESSTGSTSKVR